MNGGSVTTPKRALSNVWLRNFRYHSLPHHRVLEQQSSAPKPSNPAAPPHKAVIISSCDINLARLEQSASTMLTGFRVPAHRSPSLPVNSCAHRSPIRRACPQPASLSVRGCSNESGGAAKEAGRATGDTRIHWGSSNEGWLGTPEYPGAADVSPSEEVLSTWRSDPNEFLMDGALAQGADSHYRYLELTPDADAEEIKAAYRRLSKTYHPDTTALPLQLAAERFVRLKEAYTVLSREEERRLYDWQLAKKLARQQVGPLSYPTDYGKTMADDGSRIAKPSVDSNFVDNTVDTLGGRNMDLSEQAQTAVLFDAFAILVSICCIVYAIFFKQP